jgi:Tfp pilus assembly protein FimV
MAMGVWAASSQQTYVVKSGETLDQVIKKTLPDSPLKIEVLRQAFIQQNPQAFTNTSPRVIKAGALITVPDSELLLHTYGGRKTTSDDAHAGGDSVTPDRKNWVRFP